MEIEIEEQPKMTARNHFSRQHGQLRNYAKPATLLNGSTNLSAGLPTSPACERG
jgi:hypothetical protein